MSPDVGTSTTTHASGTAAADGSFSFDIAAARSATTSSWSPARRSNGGTAQAVRTVVNDVVQGTLLFDSTDPDRRRQRARQLRLSRRRRTSTPGAYDLTDFQVYDTGTTGDLPGPDPRPDADLRQPARRAARRRLRARSRVRRRRRQRRRFPQRNYAIAPGGAWSRLLEVQGFGQRFVDATNTNTVGTITISANQISRYITFSVDKAALGGTPASGWAFTVVLTGQDGFSSDQARGFQPTPQHFQFGVCATASSDPHCTVDPATVPKADGRAHARLASPSPTSWTTRYTARW